MENNIYIGTDYAETGDYTAFNIRKNIADHIGIDEGETGVIMYRPYEYGRLVEDYTLSQLVKMAEETADNLRGYGLNRATAVKAATELIIKHIVIV